MERRLAAIFYADVVGYSHQVQRDEEATLRRLKRLQTDVLEPRINAYQGRIVKTTGDGFLAEFASAIQAVRCAIAIQDEIRQDAAKVHMELRIGINVGDIVIDGEDVLGDGVNIAARLESKADPGGILISGTVFDQIKLTLEDRCEDIGAQALKNIAEPVRAYRVQLEGKAQSGAGLKQPTREDRRFGVRTPILAAVLLIALAAAGLLWGLTFLSSDQNHQAASSSAKIAVLPFKNLSRAKDQQFFADGLSEDLITDLSKVNSLAVISSTSSFAFRDARITLREIGRKLNARYIVEGSVRRHDKTLRISAKLVDTTSDSQLWADRFDGGTADVFAFQDEITSDIIRALKVILTPSQEKAITTRGTRNADAYDAFLRGMRLLSPRRALDVEANAQAILTFKEALIHDPSYAEAYAGIGLAHWLYHSTINSDQTQRRLAAFSNAETALKLGASALAHRVLSRKYYSPALHIATSDEPLRAMTELEAALAIEPNNPDLLAELADVLPFAGRPDRALQTIERAIALNPDHRDWYLRPLGIAQLLEKQYEKSVRSFRTWLAGEKIMTDYYLWLASALAHAGHTEQASSVLHHVNEAGGSNLPTSFYAVKRAWPLPQKAENIFLSGLRRAGFPGRLAEGWGYGKEKKQSP